MSGGLRIKEVAKDRGVTLSSIAERLGIARSNMSAIASGTRGISLKVLHKISRILGCSIDELILPERHPPIFRDRRARSQLRIVESRNYNGIDKTWVNRLMLAQKVHYAAINRDRQ